MLVEGTATRKILSESLKLSFITTILINDRYIYIYNSDGVNRLKKIGNETWIHNGLRENEVQYSFGKFHQCLTRTICVSNSQNFILCYKRQNRKEEILKANNRSILIQKIHLRTFYNFHSFSLPLSLPLFLESFLI